MAKINFPWNIVSLLTGPPTVLAGSCKLDLHCRLTVHTVGRDSSVGIATRYGLDGPGIEARWGARFSAPVQTGPGAYPASCTMGTVFLGGKAAGAWC